MNAWSFYDEATGLLTGRTFSCATASALVANTPTGCKAIAGLHDHLCRRVDLASGQLVDYVPPAPADDALQSWSWDADSKRWNSTPTAAAVAARVRAERARLLAASDWVATRAAELGQPVPEVWAQYRQQLRDVPLQAGFPGAVAWPAQPRAMPPTVQTPARTTESN